MGAQRMSVSMRDPRSRSGRLLLRIRVRPESPRLSADLREVSHQKLKQSNCPLLQSLLIQNALCHLHEDVDTDIEADEEEEISLRPSDFCGATSETAAEFENHWSEMETTPSSTDIDDSVDPTCGHDASSLSSSLEDSGYLTDTDFKLSAIEDFSVSSPVPVTVTTPLRTLDHHAVVTVENTPTMMTDDSSVNNDEKDLTSKENRCPPMEPMCCPPSPRPKPKKRKSCEALIGETEDTPLKAGRPLRPASPCALSRVPQAIRQPVFSISCMG